MDYPVLPGLRPDGKIYYNEEMGILEAELFPGGKTAHAPALLELSDGSMLCVWFTGTYEGSADVSIVCSKLPAGAKSWKRPEPVSKDPERSEQNPSLFTGPEGDVWAVYTAQLDRMPGKDNMQYTSVIRCQKSVDGGETWGEAETLFSRQGSFCRQPIQILENGRWIFANWLCSDSLTGLAGDPTVFQLSDDQGKTWRMVRMPDSNGRVHANVVELGGGRLAAFMRRRSADFIYRSESQDWGENWTVPMATSLPNNNSSISAIRLKSGRIGIAYNPTHAANPIAGTAAWPGLRCPVAVALSEDEGLTWPVIRYMERGEGYAGPENRTNNRQYEYPYLMQGTDGRLHLAFAGKDRSCIKYMCFTEDDVMGKKREKRGQYNPTAEAFTDIKK